jgi:hypothetical protein
MTALFGIILSLALLAIWSYWCIKVGVSYAAVQVNQMISRGKLVVR